MNQSINKSVSNPLSKLTPSSGAQLKSALPDGKRIAFVQAGWHREIVEQSYLSFCQTLSENGVAAEYVDLYDVPGSLEIPLQCKLLAATGDYAVIVAAGLIVDGGIYRHDFVASTVLDAMMNVQLDSRVPVLSLVLTPHHFSGSDEHHEFFHAHFKVKGEEAGNACLQTLHNMSALLAA